MDWPRLVQPFMSTTSAKVVLTAGIDEEGAPKEVKRVTLMGNYSEKMYRVQDKERRLVELSGAVYFDGDIAPELEHLDGYVFIEGSTTKREIYHSERGRNPDRTVNFTKLELK